MLEPTPEPEPESSERHTTPRRDDARPPANDRLPAVAPTRSMRRLTRRPGGCSGTGFHQARRLVSGVDADSSPPMGIQSGGFGGFLGRCDGIGALVCDFHHFSSQTGDYGDEDRTGAEGGIREEHLGDPVGAEEDLEICCQVNPCT